MRKPLFTAVIALGGLTLGLGIGPLSNFYDKLTSTANNSWGTRLHSRAAESSGTVRLNETPKRPTNEVRGTIGSGAWSKISNEIKAPIVAPGSGS